jgi:integrase
MYRHADTRVWHVDLEYADGSRRTLNLDTLDLGVAAGRAEAVCAGAEPHPPHLAASEEEGPGVVLGSVEWALAEHLQRAQPDLAAATRSMYLCQAGHVVRLLGGLAVVQLRRMHIDAYVAQRDAEGAGAETRRKELLLLRSALRTVRRLGTGTAEPEDLLLPQLRSAYTPRERWLEHAEYERVCKELAPDTRLQVLVACYSGARRSELIRMSWEDIDWKRGVMLIHGTKTKKSRRYLPLPAALRQALQPLRKAHGPILAPFGNIYREINRACRKVGIRRFSLNDCRRTFASWMLQEGVPLYDVAKLLGHGSIAMVQQVYGHLSAESLRRAVEKLPGGAAQRIAPESPC